MSDPERAALEATIRGRMDDYVEAMRSLDADRIGDFYVDHPDFLVYSDGQRMDRAGLLDLIGGLGEALESFDAEWQVVEITPLGDDAALAAASFTRSLTDAEGDVTRDWGTVTWVWTRHGDQWRLIHGQAVHYPGDLPQE